MNQPDLRQLRGVVAPEILSALKTASEKLKEAGIPHALAGGLAIGAHGYPRTTDDVDFLVGDEAFLHHAGGMVTLKLPLIAIGKVRIDFLSTGPESSSEKQFREAVDRPAMSEQIPVVPLPVLVFMKLKAGRQKDLADLVELLKRGKMEVSAIDQYLKQEGPDQVFKWEAVKKAAALEEK